MGEAGGNASEPTPPNTHTATLFPFSSRFSSPCSLFPSRPPCRHAGGSACSSQSHYPPSSKLLNPIPTNMSTTFQRPVKYSTLTSKHLSCHCVVLAIDALPPPPNRTYTARMSFYRLKQFQCEVTGKSGLDYFQALESEQLEARTMHSRFPEQLKPAILRAVQWRE
jgi:hypothetical protein